MIDIHTHHHRLNAVVDIDPVGVPLSRLRLERGYMYSVGIHPWNVERATPADLRAVMALAVERGVVAIGETGLDTLRPKGCMRMQTALFEWHAALSEEVGKPLILHVVKAWGEIIALRRRLAPSQPWIIHGFRGKPQLAEELVRCGFYLSFGAKFNPMALKVTPPSRRLMETDDSDVPLALVRAAQRRVLEV